MSAPTITRTTRPDPTAASSGSWTGTWQLVRLTVRRDRVRLVAWVLLVSMIPVLLVSATQSGYPDQAARDAFAASAATDVAQLALRGPIFSPTVGGIVAWTIGSSGLLIQAVIAILLAVRWTRTEESSGRRELLGGTPVGRHAALGATALVLLAGNLVVTLLVTLGLIGQGLPATGSVLLGAVLGAAGLCFAGIGALAGQLGASPGAARGLGLGALAVTFVVAAVGDATGTAAVWWTPVGRARHVEPFAGDHGALLIAIVALAVAAQAIAHAVATRRDLDSGVLAPRPGPAVAPRWLSGPLALAWHRHRSTVTAVGLTLLALGVVLGAVAPALPAQTGGDAASFTRLLTYVLAQLIAAGAVAVTLGLRGEEVDGRAEVLLSAAVRRGRWAGATVVAAAATAAAALIGLGLGAGVIGGLALHPGDGRAALGYAGERLGDALAFLPACLVLVGVAVALIGLLPRAAVPLTWTVVGLVFALDLGEQFSLLPDGLLYLSPFPPAVIALVSGGGALVLTPIVLLLIAAVLTGVGVLALRRRDLG